MKDWNVVVTVAENCFKEGFSFLSNYGHVEKTPFRNVLTLKVENTEAFLESFLHDMQKDPAYVRVFCRVIPCTHCFFFQTVEAFEEKAKPCIHSFLPQLAHRSFHVRMHRRGFHGTIKSQDEASLLGNYLDKQLRSQGAEGKVTFNDPDVILDVEIVAQQAGFSLWTRDQCKRYPFLKLN
ncbi:THUMP domain-containing protein [Nitrosomonas sp. Nm33]|uniref:THUMP domain-containing protein n=1 Tax=Nitrosomonas sp. Nm33 TaxID=133724 RepID=UPI0008963E81|nr:THUMP domain-containing protein [Nitrosomonas sp. Nm33]SDY62579.1 tRNA(Ser,Leu) C12 N-acetylase TAN1, contains THUMP domain [Nitrosomonas sp. Nm33]